MAQLEKIMSIYYGSNKLPYKDEDRQTHYPIAGETNTFVGENNTTKVRFFVDRIGGSNYTWVAKVKKPNGTICFRVLEMDNDDYVDVDLSFLYTDQVGQIDLALNGYTAQDITITEDDGVYEISGNPTVICTGIIKIIINYAPLILNMGATVQPNEYQQILALLSTKLGYGVESEKVNELPTTGKANTIYYVKSNESDIVYDVYYWNGTTFTYLGTTAYDLYTKEDGIAFENALRSYVNTQINDLESEIQQVASGSPAGTYATVSDLENDNPDHSKIYLVLADGKWYYYDTSASSWTAGGTYLSSLPDDYFDEDSQNSIQNATLTSKFKELCNTEEFYSILLAVKNHTIDSGSINPNNGFYVAQDNGEWTGNTMGTPKSFTLTNGKSYLYFIKLQNKDFSSVQCGFWVSSSVVGEGRITLTNLGNGWYGGKTASLSLASGIFVVQYTNTSQDSTPTTLYDAIALTSDIAIDFFGTDDIEEIFDGFGTEDLEKLSSKGNLFKIGKIKLNKVVTSNGGNAETVIEDIIDEINYPPTETFYDNTNLNSNIEEDGLLNADGTVYSYANAGISGYIDVTGGTSLTIKCEKLGNYKNLIIYDKFHQIISTYPAEEGSGGVWQPFSLTMTLPNNARYIKYCVRKNYEGDVPYELSFYGLPLTIKDKILQIENISKNNWYGKKWVAFGTSITDVNADTGKYVPFLVQLSGLNVNNQGISGGTIATGGTYGASGSILTRILATDLSDADLVTIEGFVNDFACGVPLGDNGSNTNATLFGALKLAIKYIQENSNATVVLITDSTGKSANNNDYSYDTRIVNAYKSETDHTLVELKQVDYNETIKKVAEFVGCYCIDAGAKSSINCYHPQYIADWIHHTELGGKQYAQTIWNELKNISPLEDEQ